MDAENTPQLVQTGPERFEAGLIYRYQMPSGPGPYPTAVMLHGRMGSEDVMWVFRKTIPRPWLVVAPRAPLPEQGYFSWLPPPDKWPELAEFGPAVEALTRFLRALPSLYNADPERVYLLGFSQGAAVSLAAALTTPKLVRGMAGLVGFAPEAAPEQVAGKLEGMPVFMAAGTQDHTVPRDQTQFAVDLLRRAGADLDYHEYDSGHKLPAAGISDLRAWFGAR